MRPREVGAIEASDQSVIVIGRSRDIPGVHMRQTRIRKFARAIPPQSATLESVPTPDQRRDAPRHMARQHVAIRFRNSHLICDLVDLSESGAKISVLDGVVPNVDENVMLTLFDGTRISGKVSWLRDRHIGVEFSSPVADVDERLDFENLGRDYFFKAVTLQKSMRRP
jgi:PilZ domain